jgi:hypothetical protein
MQFGDDRRNYWAKIFLVKEFSVIYLEREVSFRESFNRAKGVVNGKLI